MKPTVEQISNLLAQKRSESPGPEYWQDFLCDFHQTQREQTARKGGFANRISGAFAWFSDLGSSKWAYGAGLAYAAATVAFFLAPRDAVRENAPLVPISFQVVPAPVPPAVEQLNQLDLSPSTQGVPGEQVF